MADPGDRDLAMVRAIYEMAVQRYSEDLVLLMPDGRILCRTTGRNETQLHDTGRPLALETAQLAPLKAIFAWNERTDD
jgi:hypothetical protein